MVNVSHNITVVIVGLRSGSGSGVVGIGGGSGGSVYSATFIYLNAALQINMIQSQ